MIVNNVENLLDAATKSSNNKVMENMVPAVARRTFDPLLNCVSSPWQTNHRIYIDWKKEVIMLINFTLLETKTGPAAPSSKKIKAIHDSVIYFIIIMYSLP